MFTLLLMISFASVNAVLFTPALPNIAKYFSITDNTAELTVVWFLVGYAIGQLIYGPIANRFGRKPALYIGIGVQIVSSFLCVVAGILHTFSLLIIGRFILALGSGVGLKMTFTLVNECYEPRIASQKISYLMLAFAVTPGLGVALGGYLNEHFGWMSCFYAGAIYGLILLILVMQLPETKKELDLNAFKMKHLIHGYATQFKNSQLLAGGLLMGGSTCFVYVFAALAPFIAMNIFSLSSSQYGMANLLPPIGLFIGSIIAAQLAKKYQLYLLIRLGIIITIIGSLFMLLGVLANFSVLVSLFVPVIVIYFGICFILANASVIAMSQVSDKSHGSAVMSFLNMGLATFVVISIGFFPVAAILLPIAYLIICVGMIGFSIWLQDQKTVR
jgi:MFS transporter, DHA1 family, multidrug resistance protein